MNDNAFNILLSLLRDEAGVAERLCAVARDEKALGRLLREAARQTVEGVVIDRLVAAGAELPPDVRVQLAARLLQIERAGAKADADVAALAARYNAAGVRYAVLKGQSVARHYPIPAHRRAGDIDVYVPPCDWQRACRLLEDDGYRRTDLTGLHASYDRAGSTPVEVHFGLQRLQWPPHYKRLLRAAEAYMAHTQADGTRPTAQCLPEQAAITLCGEPVCVLSHELELVTLTAHCFNHIFNSGLGLRQIMDWRMAAIAFCGDATELERLLRTTGMRTMYGVLGVMCGVGEGSAAERELARRVLAWTAEAGNFGHSLRISGFRFYFRFLGRCWRFRALSPLETACYPLMKIKRLALGQNHLHRFRRK